MEVVLEDRQGKIAASWSIERLLNCWGAKHNEVVYVPATKLPNDEPNSLADGYTFKIEFQMKFFGVLILMLRGFSKLFIAVLCILILHRNFIQLMPSKVSDAHSGVSMTYTRRPANSMKRFILFRSILNKTSLRPIKGD